MCHTAPVRHSFLPWNNTPKRRVYRYLQRGTGTGWFVVDAAGSNYHLKSSSRSYLPSIATSHRSLCTPPAEKFSFFVCCGLFLHDTEDIHCFVYPLVFRCIVLCSSFFFACSRIEDDSMFDIWYLVTFVSHDNGWRGFGDAARSPTIVVCAERKKKNMTRM